MTLLADIAELQLFGVFERGQPNKERVVLKPTITVDIGNYAVMVGARTPTAGNLIVPLRDHMFWFGSAFLTPNDWLFLYTGHGTPSRLPSPDQSGHLYICYWGHDQTIFHDAQIVPAVVRFNGIMIEARPAPAAQSASGGLLAAAMKAK